MRTVIFDLDQTLYPEADYVRSGLRAVAQFVARHLAGDPAAYADNLETILRRDGRGKVFESFLATHGRNGRLAPETLLHVYRTHAPILRPYADAAALLTRLPGNLGMVTDGHPTVQHNKIAALGLATRFAAIVCTADIGPRAAKPAAEGFRACLERLGVEPTDAAYVGDDIAKDFAAPRALGMRTVRVVRQAEAGFGWVSAGAATEADLVVADLREAKEFLVRI